MRFIRSKIKVSFFDKELLKRFSSLLSIISLILSFVLIFISIPEQHKYLMGIGFLLVLISIYLIMWCVANLLKSVTLMINNSTVRVKVGDIFEEEGLKVIAFNEYFDTTVDDRIISKNSLNGIYIGRELDHIEEFDELLRKDSRLSENLIGKNEGRKVGKKERYKLGSTFEHGDYLLTAFTKFDSQNRAYLNMSDYINFLLDFWDEVDVLYNGRTVTIPLLGSGITRFKGYELISEQELLELLLWTFKVSKIKFKHPSHVSIVIHESMKDKINFYKLRSVDSGL